MTSSCSHHIYVAGPVEFQGNCELQDIDSGKLIGECKGEVSSCLTCLAGDLSCLFHVGQMSLAVLTPAWSLLWLPLHASMGRFLS